MTCDSGDGNDSLKLRELMEELPQELQNIVYDMTFTADPKVHIHCREGYWRHCKLNELVAELSTRVVDLNEDLHPHLLWVDRHSRQKFASSYYGPDSVFVIYGGIEYRFSSLLGSHRDLIPEPRLVTVGQIQDSLWRDRLVGQGMDAAFASRVIFTAHEDVVKLVRRRAGIDGW